MGNQKSKLKELKKAKPGTQVDVFVDRRAYGVGPGWVLGEIAELVSDAVRVEIVTPSLQVLSYWIDFDNPRMPDLLAPAGTFTGPNSDTRELGEKGKSMVKSAIHEYSKGYFVDVLDYWRDKTGRTRRTWRKAEIVATTDTHVLVHYLKFNSIWDEWFDLTNPAFAARIAEYGTKSDSAGMFRKSEAELLFEASIKSIGWTLREVPARGDCLFCAVALQVYGKVDHHFRVRAETVAHMREYAELFKPFMEDGKPFESYLARMAREREWGGHLELIAIENVYDRPIELYRATGGSVKPEYPGELPASLPPREPIRLSYHNGNHYNAVLPPDVADKLPLRELSTKEILNHRLRSVQSTRLTLQRLTSHREIYGGEPKTPASSDGKEAESTPDSVPVGVPLSGPDGIPVGVPAQPSLVRQLSDKGRNLFSTAFARGSGEAPPAASGGGAGAPSTQPPPPSLHRQASKEMQDYSVGILPGMRPSGSRVGRAARSAYSSAIDRSRGAFW